MNSSIVQCDTFALIRRHNCVSRNFYADEFKSCDFGYRGLICYWIHWHWFLAFVARTEAQSIVVLQCECRIWFVPKTSSQPQVGGELRSNPIFSWAPQIWIRQTKRFSPFNLPKNWFIQIAVATPIVHYIIIPCLLDETNLFWTKPSVVLDVSFFFIFFRWGIFYD